MSLRILRFASILARETPGEDHTSTAGPWTLPPFPCGAVVETTRDDSDCVPAPFTTGTPKLELGFGGNPAWQGGHHTRHAMFASQEEDIPCRASLTLVGSWTTGYLRAGTGRREERAQAVKDQSKTESWNDDDAQYPDFPRVFVQYMPNDPAHAMGSRGSYKGPTLNQPAMISHCSAMIGQPWTDSSLNGPNIHTALGQSKMDHHRPNPFRFTPHTSQTGVPYKLVRPRWQRKTAVSRYNITCLIGRRHACTTGAEPCSPGRFSDNYPTAGHLAPSRLPTPLHVGRGVHENDIDSGLGLGGMPCNMTDIADRRTSLVCFLLTAISHACSRVMLIYP
ncbi:hypothetical protein ACRALDRAFT_206606 [Sodiomyces alcalophilus JCM 7366]|uniref:uncharacterized protein n=1 Tax=Sodiomyces alcalophilus JCM 7366 TaxID=591952 RepID=UPI0039B4A9DC